jgi:hypothetical protein
MAGLYRKAYCFYNKHVKAVGTTLAFAFLVMLSVVGVKIYSDCRLKKIEHRYASLFNSNNTDKIAFVEKYGCSPLGGLMLLEFGDDAFCRRNYKLASHYYKRAAKALKKAELAVHVLILQAISLFLAGNQENGSNILDRIICNRSFSDYLRLEALYRYICCLKASGDVGKASEILCRFDKRKIPMEWRERLIAELR